MVIAFYAGLQLGHCIVLFLGRTLYSWKPPFTQDLISSSDDCSGNLLKMLGRNPLSE